MTPIEKTLCVWSVICLVVKHIPDGIVGCGVAAGGHDACITDASATTRDRSQEFFLGQLVVLRSVASGTRKYEIHELSCESESGRPLSVDLLCTFVAVIVSYDVVEQPVLRLRQLDRAINR